MLHARVALSPALELDVVTVGAAAYPCGPEGARPWDFKEHLELP